MGRPSKPLITREQIAQAALELLDEQGPNGLGMRPLAQRLQVQAPSLYHHVAGMDEVITLVHDLVDAQIDLDTLDDPDWRAGLEAFARSYRQAFRDHPHVLPLVVRRPMKAPKALELYEKVAATLHRIGLPRAAVLQFMAVLDYIVLGSALDNFLVGFAELNEVDAALPHLRAALAEGDPQTMDDVAFSAAITALIDALAGQLVT